MKRICFDKEHFQNAANEVLDDIEIQKLRSKSWLWMAGGAILGFIASCMRLKSSSGKPILAKFWKPNKTGGRI